MRVLRLGQFVVVVELLRKRWPTRLSASTTRHETARTVILSWRRSILLITIGRAQHGEG